MIDIIGYVSAGTVLLVGGVIATLLAIFIFFTILKVMLGAWK